MELPGTIPPHQVMQTAQRTTASRDVRELVRAATVAQRFFVDERSKQQIATEFAISRFKVARLLDLARESGLVRIEIAAPLSLDVKLGRLVRDAYGLADAWVVDLDERAPDPVARRLGQVGATMVAALVVSDKPVGIAWGRTMRALADSITDLPRCPVVQIAGGIRGDLDDDAAVVARQLARASGGPAHLLHAPLFVADAHVAAGLRAERTVSLTLERFEELQLVIVGVGAWHAASGLATTVLLQDDVDHLSEQGAVAEFCGVFLAEDGSEVGTRLDGRALAISAAQLRAVPCVVAVAGGPGKELAVQAVARSGLCTHLVTDRVVAEALLASARDEERE